MYLNHRKIKISKIIAIIQIALFGLFSVASIVVTGDYLAPDSGMDSMDRIIAIGMTAFFILMTLSGIRKAFLLGTSAGYAEAFCMKTREKQLSLEVLAEITGKSASRMDRELTWLIKKDYLKKCAIIGKEGSPQERFVILEGADLTEHKLISVTCNHCGASMTVPEGIGGTCEYCGTYIQG